MNEKEIEYFSISVFNYLSQELFYNYKDILSLQFTYEDNNIFATNYFYTIKLNVKRFMVDMPDIYIKNKILFILTHEVFHELQIYDIYKYSISKEYKSFIESNADYSAMNFINSNSEKISMYFNIPIYWYNVNMNYSIHNQQYLIQIKNDNLELSLLSGILQNVTKIDIESIYNLYYSDRDIIIEIEDFSINTNSKYFVKSNNVINIYLLINIINIIFKNNKNNCIKTEINEREKTTIFKIYI